MARSVESKRSSSIDWYITQCDDHGPLGTLVYVAGRSGNRLAWVARDGTTIPAEATEGTYRWPRISPDGSQVAVTIASHATGVTSVWVGGAVLKAHGHTPRWANGGLAPESRAAYDTIDLHFHDLRHEAGSRWLEAGIPLHHVKALLGHSNIATTDTYLNAGRVHLRESMRKLDQIGTNATFLPHHDDHGAAARREEKL